MRTRPVNRNEVRVYFNWWKSQPQILAIPADACREVEGKTYPIIKLFKPMMAEIANEWRAWKAEHDCRQATWDDEYRKAVTALHGEEDGSRGARAPKLADHEFDCSYEHTCRECGVEFLSSRVLHRKGISVSRDSFCSNACADRAARRSTARLQAAVVKHRSEERWEARSDLKCQHCGAALAAERRSKQYCSGRCRVAALRARRA